MNIPHFDITRIPVDPSSSDFMSAVVREERRVCGALDERIDALVSEFVSLAREAKELAMSLDTTNGFFARMKIRSKLRAVGRRLSDNMDIRNELVTARWRRTYGS
jgi:hypothetical protein